MTDKDLLERSVIKDTFSEANVIICIFHSMRTFSREITCEKMGISQADRNKSLELLQKMVYAKTEGEFEQLHNVLNISAPKRVIEYFEKNWYPIKDEWSMSKNFMKGFFQNTTNNRIESINVKLKSVITKNSTLVESVHSFSKAQTYGQKRRKALITTDSLANLVAMSSNDSFDQKLDNLKTLEMLWKQGKRIRVIMINEDEAELSSSNVNKNSLDVENMPIVLADTDTVQIEVITNVSVNSENTLEHASSTETASNEGTNIQAFGTTSDELTSIKMPQKIKKRGRPKGSNLTTIGLPKRKKANIIPFLNMPFQNKQKKC
jgi:hypothetical protein